MNSVLIICGLSMLVCAIYTLILPMIDSAKQRDRTEGHLNASTGLHRGNQTHPAG